MKKLKIYTFIIAILLVISIFPNTVLANNIETLNIEATIQEDGAVIIRDHRVFNVDSGTEHFISLGNLADSELVYAKVFEGDKEYDFVDNWDIDWSRQEKANKVGIYENKRNTEISFGIGEYGTKDVIIEYKITNFIKNLEDGYQAFYWQFINQDMERNKNINISVKNTKGFEYIYDATRLWAFGLPNANVVIEPDELKVNAPNGVKSNQYIVILSILPENTFNSSSQLNKISQELIDQAMDGASQKEDKSLFSKIGDVIGNIFIYLTIFLTGIFTIIAIVAGFHVRKERKFLKPTIGKKSYYREVPFMDDFANLQYINHSTSTGIQSAYILKWINYDYLDAVKYKDEYDQDALKYKLLISHEEAEKIELAMGKKEKIIWDIFINSADESGYITMDSINESIKDDYKNFYYWDKDLYEDSKVYLINEDYLNVQAGKNRFSANQSIPTEKGQNLINNIKGFENFLRDFSLIEKRGVNSIDLWTDYLVFAAYLGKAETVYEEMKKLEPSFVTNSKLGNDTVVLTNNFMTYSNLGTSGGSSSSGGGGSSFSGGGGGSFGGGSGGGSR